MFKGIDISIHNKDINFKKVKASGIKAVIIKATEGVDFIDKNLEKNYKGAQSSNMDIGFYHFMSEKTSPTKQAKDFWNAIKDKKFNIIPCLDIEVNTLKRNKTEISNRCIEFLEEFKKLSGYDCIIYTGGYFGRDLLDNRVKKYLGWIAHYGVNEPMKTGFKVCGHQFTEHGAVEGINTRVDLNNFNDLIFIKKNLSSVNGSLNDKKELWQISINGALIIDLQKELNKQFNANLKVDGYFGENTLKKCINVSRGATGNITRIIQKRLKELGYKLIVDGIFGNETYKAITLLQKKYNLKTDGIVGKETWKALFKK